LKEPKYKYNQTILKVFGINENKKIKVITMKVLRTAGLVDDDKDKKFSLVDDDKDDKDKKRETVNTEKMEESISRTKSRIFEIAFCNPWDWFFTGTLDPKKYDRTDLDNYHKKLTQWIRDYNKKHNIKIKFLFIPELHSDGKSWHIHGFIYGLPVEHLKQFQLGDTMGKGLSDKVKKGDTVYNWLPYANKFGFCDLEPIRNHEAVSKYITKYITKNLASCVKELNAHQYYASRGLNRAETIKKGTMFADIAPTYENEYCRVTWLDYSDELLAQLESSII
jgi:hypothetical protein